MSVMSERAAVQSARSRRHWVIAELDARGAIDRHATMCLEHTIDGVLASDARAIVVDLRDLTSIDAESLALFVEARADCHAHDVELELLISGHASHHAIADAIDSAGLLDQLHSTRELRLVARSRPHLMHDPPPTGRGARLRVAAGRLSPLRLRRRGSPELRRQRRAARARRAG